jgi:hypothetical protein
MDAARRLPTDLLIAGAIFIALLAVYSANGREIGSYDSRPVALAARELLLRGTTSLNHVVGQTPAYATRWGFMLAKDGNYRAVYSPVPSMVAAALTWPFWKAGLIDINAPLAPALMAKTTASILVALAVALSYLTATTWTSRRSAILLAMGLGLGTGFWSSVSQTLWQTETGVFGLSLAILGFCRLEKDSRRWPALAIGAGLALAGTARPQLGPAVVVLVAGTWRRTSMRDAALATAIVSVAALLYCWTNWRWFGHPLGALPLLESVNADIHGTRSTFILGVEPYLGLLISPSRGLLVFSPIVAVVALGVSRAFGAGSRSPLPWVVGAAAVEILQYGSFAVWWGGHTYGPRYMLDVLPTLVPLAAAGMAVLEARAWLRVIAAAALIWSVGVSGLGAFVYPNEQWNNDPVDVDSHHRRLWDWHDPQILRAAHAPWSPQNFALAEASYRPHAARAGGD